MSKNLLCSKDIISLNSGATKVSLFGDPDNYEYFPSYQAIIEVLTKDGETAELEIGGLHFNCPRMGRHVVGIMDSISADYGEVAWQMFANNRVMRKPLPLGHIYGCWEMRLLKGSYQAFQQEPPLLENAIEKTLEIFRETALSGDKSPLYFVYYGGLGYMLGEGDLTDYENDTSFDSRNDPVLEAALYRAPGDKEEGLTIPDNNLYNVFAKTNLTLFRCTGGLCGGKNNFLAVHDAACIGDPNKKKRQTKIPILSPLKQQEEDDDDDWFY